MKTLLEHLEPEVYEWCVLEYRHISNIVGSENLIITNVPKKEWHKLEGLGELHEEKVAELGYDNVCLLDPDAKELLNPKDKNEFTYYLFGGILGNYPPQKRTKEELTKKLPYPARNIGEKQMSTDTAVNVVHKIIDEEKTFTELEFCEEIEIVLDEGYSNILPYRYLVENGKPILPEGLIEHLAKD